MNEALVAGPVTVVAVVGPVEPALLTAWCAHYRALGVDRFAVALHTPDPRRADRLDLLADVFRDATGELVELLVTSPWHEHTNTELREQLRARAGTGWHLLADADEFQHHPNGLRASLALAHHGGGVLGGLLLDRVAADGTFPHWNTRSGPDRTYPLGGLLTHELLRADARKIVIARAGVTIASGNHRAPGRRPPPHAVVPVHHFKWRTGVLEHLRARIANFTTGRWRETTPALRSEAARLLDHLIPDGRLDVAAGPVLFRPVTLRALPDWWPQQSRHVVETWRPPRWVGTDA